MKYTHLDMVQNILSAMNSDEVNSWSDTAESRQVAQILQDTYHEIVARADLPEHYKFVELNDSLDVNKPTILFKPSTVSSIMWLDYNCAELPPNDETNYRRVRFYNIEDFLNVIDGFNTDEDNVGSFVHLNKIYKFVDDKHPDFYTVLEDGTIIFDSYNNDVETTLHTTRVRAYGKEIPTYTLTNVFVPDLDDDHFVILLNEAKDRAFQEIKQMPNPKSQIEARRAWRTLSRTKEFKKPNALDLFADFGRRRP